MALRERIEDKMIYLFPELTDKDKEELKNYNLEYLGDNYFEEELSNVVRGTEKDLKRYAKEYLDYILHPSYLYDEDDFVGNIVNTNNKWYGLSNYSDMLGATVLLVSKDKEELSKHWKDLIDITDKAEGTSEYTNRVVEPLIKELKQKGILVLDTDYETNLDRLTKDKFSYNGDLVEIIKQSHSRF